MGRHSNALAPLVAKGWLTDMKGRLVDSPTEKQAVGISLGKMMKIVCAFDIDTWEDVRLRAAKRKISFAEQVRRLVEMGLEEDTDNLL